MLPIQKKLISYNFTRDTNNPKYIVIHDTDNTGNGANANAHFNYFNGGNRNASAHVFVDDNNIIQTVEFKDSSWHCGDGGNRNGISNQNSIGIEICVNSDGDYNKAVNNTIELTKYLMKEYNIDINNVVRHYDASGKNCPQSMSANSWQKWKEFKSMLTEKPTYYRIITGGFNTLEKLSNAINSYFKGINIYIRLDANNNYYLETGDFNSREEANNYAKKFSNDKYYYEIKTVQY
jgi:N-acetylmuramoyl-L-alanine amidase CwlA